MKHKKYNNKRVLFGELEGLMVGNGVMHVTLALKKYDNVYYLLTCDNGVDLFIKHDGIVRVSTEDEYEAFQAWQWEEWRKADEKYTGEKRYE